MQGRLPTGRTRQSTVETRPPSIIGPLNVAQQPGEDGEQLARRIVQVLHQDYIGVNGLARMTIAL